MQLIDGKRVYSATDLVGFLECEHLTDLELGAMAGHVTRPERVDAELDRIRKRGEQHEERYLEGLERDGRSVTRLKLPQDEWSGGRRERYATAAQLTRDAIWRGDDVIYQACFFDGTWLGFADFLLRVQPEPGQQPPLGHLYEVADTKLARHAKASALLQMCGYTEALTAIQGIEPLRMHVALGGSKHETASFRVKDHMAYFRAVKARFEAAVAGEHPWPAASYPEPVQHCEVCRWDEVCRKRRRDDDHLSLVAGIAGRTRQELVSERGITTRRGLAMMSDPVVALAHTKAAALERVRDQAHIQVEGEDLDKPLHELLPVARLRDGSLEPDKGLLALPRPSEGDLFLDLEGDPFALEDGVDYLFGILEPGLTDPETGAPMFHAFWARDESGAVTHAAERRAFEQVIDFIIDRLERDPDLHVYHYAPYEPTALKRLMGRYATREVEVDRLLRGRVLVDLYRVVRQGIRASVESYSIKRLEEHYGFVREAELRAAGDSIAMFEEWLELGGESGGLEETIELIRRYNRDDVISTWKLREWLEDIVRPELADTLGIALVDLPRHSPGKPEEGPRLAEWLKRVQAVAEPLLAGVPEEATERTEPQQARWLLAQLLGWHRREKKVEWWRYYQLTKEYTDEELVDEPEPLALLEHIGQGEEPDTFVYRFPRQEYEVEAGKDAKDTRTEEAVAVRAIDDEACTIVLRHKRGRVGKHPRSLVLDPSFPTTAQEESLLRIGESVAANPIEGDGPYRSARDLLLRRHPRVGQTEGEPLHRPGPGDSLEGTARRLALALDQTTLPIQGPPGSGKTYTGARMILDLVAKRRKVGVTSNSHKVIGNLLDAVVEAAKQDGRFRDTGIRIGQKPGSDEKPTCQPATPYTTNDAARAALRDSQVDVMGGTAWLWAREDMQGSVDVLFIDEAGQFSLANALAVSPAAPSMVLLGDPQQLDQPIKGTHPDGAQRSALAHLLEVRGASVQVMPSDRGLFLERTWRMHPDITRYTSEMFYSKQLDPEPGNDLQWLTGTGTLDGVGIRWVGVPHSMREDTDSTEEAIAVATMIDELLGSEPTWIDREGLEHPLTSEHILVLTPYNDQRRLVEEMLAVRGHGEVRVGTVDKFQGQEAPISIYTMASSSAEDAPRGMEFLYSLNRLNVATSRARCLTVAVASPELIRVRCKTPRQMQLANALCRLVELAAP